MNRLYVVESTPSSTGAKADHRLPVQAGEVESFARALLTLAARRLIPRRHGRPRAAEVLGCRGEGSAELIAVPASSFPAIISLPPFMLSRMR